MLSRQFLVKLSKIIATVLCLNEKGDENLPFVGLNIFLVGDFHQFPPVVCGHAAPLYYPNNLRHDNTDAAIGREICEQFLTVVQLRKKVRVDDMPVGRSASACSVWKLQGSTYQSSSIPYYN